MNMLLLSIENASKLKDTVNALNNMYIRDPLTNLLNRRGFYREIDMLIFDATQKKKDILIVSVDLDGLKYINDNFGHSEGDYAIVSIANLLSSITSDSGLCARFGGDEYLAAIVDSKNIEDFEKLFKDGMKTINEKSNKPYRINASFGLEFISPTQAQESLQDAIRRADDKMFKNKKKSKYSRNMHMG
jgi:diguanylate cyclase (GGDEF)-like protein